MDQFLYDIGLRHERVKVICKNHLKLIFSKRVFAVNSGLTSFRFVFV